MAGAPVGGPPAPPGDQGLKETSPAATNPTTMILFTCNLLPQPQPIKDLINSSPASTINPLPLKINQNFGFSSSQPGLHNKYLLVSTTRASLHL